MNGRGHYIQSDYTAAVRIWMLLLAFSGIFWLGGTTLRAMIANEFFIPGTLEFHPEITMDQERTLFQLIYASTIFVLINYVILAVSAVVALVKLPLRFKRNGWLLIAALLFLIFVPVELFTGYLDLKFIMLWINTIDILDAQGLQVYIEHSALMRETLSHRIGALGGLPVMALICYFTAVAVIVWQPLKFGNPADLNAGAVEASVLADGADPLPDR